MWAASGVGDIVRIDGIMNAEKLRQVLIHHGIPSESAWLGMVLFFSMITICIPDLSMGSPGQRKK